LITHSPIAQALKPTIHWKQIALAIGLVIVLLLAHLLASPVAACPTEAENTEIELCVDTIVSSPSSLEIRNLSIDTLSAIDPTSHRL
jgi:hypothetical protein